MVSSGVKILLGTSVALGNPASFKLYFLYLKSAHFPFEQIIQGVHDYDWTSIRTNIQISVLYYKYLY